MTMIPLILVPGVLCDRTLFAPQLAALSDIADIHVTDEHLYHDDIGEIADAILADAPERFAVAGLSFGGYIVFELLRRAPQRISHAAFLDTSARADTEERKQARAKDLARVGEGRFIGVSEGLLPLFMHPDHLADDNLRNRVKNMTQRVGEEAFVSQIHAVMSRPDSRPDLAAITCPTLVLVGAEDQMTPPELAREIHAGIAGSRLVEVPHCGHLATIEQPEAVNAALREWLAD
ncbi:MAG: alpha/beta fold hydrolase [Alphaproteobacteria bacterium]